MHAKKQRGKQPNKLSKLEASEEQKKVVSVRIQSFQPTNSQDWLVHWEKLGWQWRIKPEIDDKRKNDLTKCLGVVPNIEEDKYPFKDVKLNRADIEWLLTKLDNGPIDWNKEEQRGYKGLDLRGANLREEDLSGLPLACLCGGLSWGDRLEYPNHSEQAGIKLEGARLLGAHLEGAKLLGAHLEKADFSEAHLEKASFYDTNLENAAFTDAYVKEAEFGRSHMKNVSFGGAHLELADFYWAHLEKADFSEAHLKWTNFTEANLENADFGADVENGIINGANMEGANFYGANLKNANLRRVHLAGATFFGAHLEGADLSEAHLEGKNVDPNDLEDIIKYIEVLKILSTSSWLPSLNLDSLYPTVLREVFFDTGTKLENITLGNEMYGFVSLVDIRWGNVNLALVDWKALKILGDEYEANQLKDKNEQVKSKSTRIAEYETAIRANRQLSLALQSQGLNEYASYFGYRAQVLQRQVLALKLIETDKRDFKPILVGGLFLLLAPMLITVSEIYKLQMGVIPPLLLSMTKLSLSMPVFITSTFLGVLFLLKQFLSLLLPSDLKKDKNPILLFIVTLLLAAVGFLLLTPLIYLPFMLISIWLWLDVNGLFANFIFFVFLLLTIILIILSYLWSHLWFYKKFHFFSRILIVLISILKYISSIVFLLAKEMSNYGKYTFSLFLDLLAGYGYKPGRSVIAYVIVIIGFDIVYYALGQSVGPHLSPLGALVLSVSSFHGRGFFPGTGSPSGSIPLDDPITVAAAIEAVVGLLIEISFIATFTQRFFGK